MPSVAVPLAEERNRASLPAPAGEAETWLDQALADSFPDGDPLASHRFDRICRNRIDDDGRSPASSRDDRGDPGARQPDHPGLANDDFTPEQRDHVCAHDPCETNVKDAVIDHFAQGTIRKPETTFGNVNADVLALEDPSDRQMNVCSISLAWPWPQ